MEKHEYLKMAEVEDHMWYYRCLHARMREGVRRNQPEGAALALLDAGCGTGGLLGRLRGWHPTWTLQGLDIEPIACELARKRGLDVQVGSVTAVPFASAVFDAITCADVLYHSLDYREALREFGRCLKPGGVVVINVPAYRWLWSYHDVRTHGRHRFTRREMLGLLQEAGFAPVQSTYWNTLPFPLIVLRRKVFPPRSEESDVKLYPPLLESVFNAGMALEQAWTRLARLPFGSSVFVVARKPA